MKKTVFILILNSAFSILNLNAQAPQAIPYQAVARDINGNAIANQNVSLRFSIHDSTISGTVVYREKQNTITNSFGLFTLNIGQGTVLNGTFANVNWGINPKFLQVESDFTGGTTYIDMGSQQMLSVPYALSAGNVNWTKTGNDISNSNSGNIGIGTTTPATSAQLEVNSANKGFLPPRMTFTQRNNIQNPVAGLIIYCINCAATGELEMYNGSAWTNIVGGASNSGTVTMCNQTWMINNLNVSTYRNGDIIPQVTNSLTWGALNTGAWCWYNNDSATYASTYGKLYNWYAATDVRGLAPAGWHVPSDSEWTILESCLGGGSIAGGKMKETGTIHWLSPNTGATNSSGFTGLPGGTRYNDGVFNLINNYGFWWSTTPNAAIDAYFRFLVYNNGTVTRANFAKPDGFSVRCVRD